MKNSSTIGARIKSLRTQKRLSQEELGKAIGLSQNSISKLENGDITLTIENLIKLSDFFNVSTDFICTGQSNENILALLEKYSRIEYHSSDFNNKRYEYPVLLVYKMYFEYLIRTARAKNDKFMPEDIRALWLEKEAQEFYKTKSPQTPSDFITIVPIPDKMINSPDSSFPQEAVDFITDIEGFYST